jgi:predicted Zn finger-like uncharacterized protein
MPIQINCPSCSSTLRVTNDLLGSPVKCPRCATVFTANEPEERRPEPPPVAREAYREEASRPRRPDDEDAPRSSRRRDEDEDYDDWPRRSRYVRTQPHRGVAVLILGIVSLVGLMFCGPAALVGIAAWVMGHHDLRAMREGRMDDSGRGLTMAGYVMGIIGTVLVVLAFVVVIVGFATGLLK